MANPCCNINVFFTNDEDKSELLRLHNNISSVVQAALNAPKGPEPAWLGEIAKIHGIDIQNISCRGSIEYLEDYDPESDHVKLETETAWNPTTELWEAVASKYKGISFVYRAEEAGSDIFINTDAEGTYLPERYLLDIDGNMTIPEGWYPNQKKPEYIEIYEYFESFDALSKYCANITGITFEDFVAMKDYLDDIFASEENTTFGLREFKNE